MTSEGNNHTTFTFFFLLSFFSLCIPSHCHLHIFVLLVCVCISSMYKKHSKKKNHTSFPFSFIFYFLFEYSISLFFVCTVCIHISCAFITTSRYGYNKCLVGFNHLAVSECQVRYWLSRADQRLIKLHLISHIFFFLPR